MMTQDTFVQEVIFAETYKKTKCPIAFGKLYELFYASVFDYILLIVKDSHIAFDLTQETFITVSEKLKFLREVRALRLWIFRIAKNKSIKYLKSRSNEIKLLHNMKPECSTSEDRIEELIDKEKKYDLLDEIIGQLRSEDKYLMISKYFHDMTIEELANQTGLGKSAIKMKIHRTRLKLKDMMMKDMSM